MTKFTPCKKCDHGYYFDNTTGVATSCGCLIAYQKDVRKQVALQRAGIEGFDLTFDNYKGKDLNQNLLKLKKYISEIKTTYANGSHLYFTGPNGTQKSTVAKIVLRSCVEQGLSGKFILMSDLVDILTDVYSNDPKRESELDVLRTVDMLIIDDAFDKNKVTLYKSGYQLSFIDRFIRTRLEVIHNNTIFTSNVAIDKISENGFTKDIQNLLTRSVKVKKGELLFTDVWVEEELDIKSLWD
jgi:DNA replication protein DnaC